MHIILNGFLKIFLPIGLLFSLPVDVFPKTEIDWTSPLQQCRTYLTENMSTIEVASDNVNTLYLPKSDGRIEAINLTAGARVWTTEVSGGITEKITSDENFLYVVTEVMDRDFIGKESGSGDRSYISIVSKNDGLVLEKFSLNYENTKYFHKTSGGYFISSGRGTLESFDTLRKIQWTNKLNTELTGEPVFFTDNQNKSLIVFGTANNTLIFISADSGRITRQIYTKTTPSVVNFGGDFIVTGDTKGSLYMSDLLSGRAVWKSYTGGRITDISILKDSILASSDDNYLYLLYKKNGNRIWKINLGGRIIGKAFLDEENILVLPQGTNTAFIINLVRGKIINRIVLEKDAYFVSSPLSVGNQLILPTQKGLYFYAMDCAAIKQVMQDTR